MFEKALEFSKPKAGKLVEHLEKEQDAIIACLNCLDEEKKILQQFEKKQALFLDYELSQEEMKLRNILGKEKYFLISPVDQSDKYSRDFNVCYGLVVVGREKDSNKNISFMTHQVPSSLYDEEAQQEIESKIKEIQTRSQKGSVDAVIFGGATNYSEDKEFRNMLEKDYKKDIKYFSDFLKEQLSFSPIVISHQNQIMSERKDEGELYQHIYFDNSKRKLYIFKSQNSLDFNKKSYRF